MNYSSSSHALARYCVDSFLTLLTVRQRAGNKPASQDKGYNKRPALRKIRHDSLPRNHH